MTSHRDGLTVRPKIGKYKPKRELADLIIEYFLVSALEPNVSDQKVKT